MGGNFKKITILNSNHPFMTGYCQNNAKHLECITGLFPGGLNCISGNGFYCNNSFTGCTNLTRVEFANIEYQEEGKPIAHNINEDGTYNNYIDSCRVLNNGFIFPNSPLDAQSLYGIALMAYDWINDPNNRATVFQSNPAFLVKKNLFTADQKQTLIEIGWDTEVKSIIEAKGWTY